MEPPKPKEPGIDILGFDDDIPPRNPSKEFSSSLARNPPRALWKMTTIFDDSIRNANHQRLPTLQYHTTHTII